MPDLGLAVTVSRTALGLADLDINDHVAYRCAAQLLGGQVTWRRNQVTSPWVDGAVTVSRAREMVTEQLGVEVFGADATELEAHVTTLIQAFQQSSFTLTVTVESLAHGYACEAADINYAQFWNGPRLVARQAQLVFSVPRQPVPTAGVF
jgi:hypothetical protein